MKTVYFILIFSFLSTFSNYSYGQDSELSLKATKMTESLKDQINLTEEQVREIYDIQMEYLVKVSKLDKSNLSDGVFYSQRNTLNNSRIADIKALLTSEQSDLFDRSTSR